MRTFHRRSKPKKIKYCGKTYIYDEERTEEFRGNPYEDFKGSILVKVLARNLELREDFHGKPYQPIAYVFSTRPKKSNSDTGLDAAESQLYKFI